MTDPVADSLRAVLPYIEEWVGYRAWKSRIPGVQLAVLFDGEVQLSTAFGFADVERGVPLTTGHLFRIASHSKTFTATAVLQLAEQGLVRLDDPVGRFVPELGDAGSALASITLRELLSHAGGVIRDGKDGDFWQFARPYPDRGELLSMLIDGGDIQPPNVSFKYTNVGYSLLGLVVEAAAGMTYNDYVTLNICEALGLHDLGPEWREDRAADFAVGYSGFQTRQYRTPLEPVDTRAFSPATGFFGTAADLVQFAAAHFPGDERLLTDASKRAQQHEAWNSNPSAPGAASYGYGMIIEEIDGHRWVGHSGGFPGHITRTLFDPEGRIAISVLTNAIDGPASELSSGVARLLDAALQRDRMRASEAHGHGADPAPFLGRYGNLWGVIDIVRLGERLVVIHPGKPNPTEELDELEVTGETTLRIVKGSGFGAVGEEFSAEFAADGSVALLRGGGGMSYRPVTELDASVTP